MNSIEEIKVIAERQWGGFRMLGEFHSETFSAAGETYFVWRPNHRKHWLVGVQYTDDQGRLRVADRTGGMSNRMAREVAISEAMLEAVARNPSTTPETLAWLVSDRRVRVRVRCAALRNPATPAKAVEARSQIKELHPKEEQVIRERLAQRLDLS